MTFSLILVILVSISIGVKPTTADCPPPIQGSPCSCDPVENSIICHGVNTQQEFDDFFTTFYNHNRNQLKNQGQVTGVKTTVQINELRLDSLNTVTLEINKLENFKINLLHIVQCTRVTEFTSPCCLMGSIEISNLFLESNWWSQSRVMNVFLHHVVGIKEFKARNSTIEDIEETISMISSAEVLDLKDNFITGVDRRTFEYLPRVQYIGLENNMISLVDADAFDPGNPAPDLITAVLTINMTGNQMTDGNWSPTSGIASLFRPSILDLSHNNFVYISSPNFETYLFSNPKNVLILNGNTFLCDGRMGWLRDAKQLLEHRVHGIDCLNDPGQTIFTTSLPLDP